MQNQPLSNAAGFTMVPMIPQQFYQMAQHHAAVNAAFPIPASVAYMSLPDAEVYSSVPSSTYSVPQHVVHSDVYAPDSSAANALYWPQSYDPYPRSYCAYPIDGIDSFRQETASSSSGVYNKETLSRPNVAAPEASHLTTIMLPTPRDTSANSVVNAESSSEMLSDAPIADEHKWRKYGQKQVKRSPYPRNYYKCTVSGCPAKKHLEKFWDPTLNRERCRTVFLGEHVHPVAVSPQVFASTQADFQSNVLAQSAKIRESPSEPEASPQQRLVVECGTHVDENEDGYSWRKYGQKSVKGSVTPRQYYRCRVTGCPVKKTVEASLKGNTIVTYDGCHNHEPGVCTPESDPSSPTAVPLGYPSAYYSPCPSTSASTSLPTSPSVMSDSTPRSGSISSDVASCDTQEVYSPGSYSGTSTDDDESYLSEPSPKRFIKEENHCEEGVSHSFAADMPSADVWYAAWDPELILPQ